MAGRALVERAARPGAANSDAVLAAAAAGGDAAAFAELYQRHSRAIYGYCRRVLRSAEEAADATHEAFVNVLERLRDVQRPIVAPRPYLFRAAHHACLRIAAGRRTDGAPGEDPPAAPPDGDLNETERIVLTRELQEEVRAANDELSLRQREILALREVEHLRYDEIARIMDMTPNAAAQLAWRARARLRTCMRRRAFDAIVLQTLDCERALGLLELAEDAGGLSPEEDEWLARHFVGCARCASNRAVLAEVGATYRSWVPAGAVPLLTIALLQKAGEVVGATWGGGAAAAGGAAGGGVAAGAGAGATAGGGAAAPAAVTAGTVVAASGGTIASVPTAMVVAAALAVGTGGATMHQASSHRARAVTARPPALVAHAVPVRAPKLSPEPVFKPAVEPVPAAAPAPAVPEGATAPPEVVSVEAPAPAPEPAPALAETPPDVPQPPTVEPSAEPALEAPRPLSSRQPVERPAAGGETVIDVERPGRTPRLPVVVPVKKTLPVPAPEESRVVTAPRPVLPVKPPQAAKPLPVPGPEPELELVVPAPRPPAPGLAKAPGLQREGTTGPQALTPAAPAVPVPVPPLVSP